MTIKNIQGLRAVAALLVVFVHLGNPNGFEHRYLANPHPFTEALARIGYLGVDLFFLISGFIMVVTTFRAKEKKLSSINFLKRRIIRIYPPLWIINTFVLAVFLLKPSLVNSHSAVPTNIWASYLLLPQAGNALVLVAWTLVYEMFFYLVFALGLLGGLRTLTLTLIAWVSLLALANRINPDPQNIYVAFLQNPIVSEFILGAAIGIMSRKSFPSWFAMTSFLAGLIGSLIVAIPLALGSRGFPEGWTRVESAIPLAGILLGLVLLERRFGAWTPRYVQRLGDASYSLYLWHIPTLTLMGIILHGAHLHTPLAQVLGLLLTMTAVIAVAMVVYRCLELPLTNWLRVRCG